MPRTKILRKRPRRTKRLPTPSLDEESEMLENPFKKSPILIGKNVDFANFIIEPPVFYIEEYFENMG